MNITTNNRHAENFSRSHKGKINLIALPYAGGSANYFQALRMAIAEQDLQSKINFIEVTLPGRARRYNEPLLTNLDDIVEDIWKQTQQYLYNSYAIFGHSMGSLLGYLLAQKARKFGLMPPKHLFLSGREGPSVPPTPEKDYLLPTKEFKALLKGYGGINSEILENNDLFVFFEPILRADFQAVETWKYRFFPKLNVPATVFTATEEDHTLEEAMAWQKEFIDAIRLKVFDGKHFFINDNAQSIAEIIMDQIGYSRTAALA